MNPVGHIDLDRLGLNAGARVLDLGCSVGTHALPIAQQGYRVTGFDNSLELAAALRRNLGDTGVACGVVVGDAAKLPFPDATFEAVISTEVFEHLPEPEEAAHEVARVLREGGHALIAVPTSRSERLFRLLHPHWVEDSGHINVFTERRLTEVLTRAGFDIEHVSRVNVEWSVFWILHSIARSRFDFTGMPREHQWLTRAFFKVWGLIRRTRLSSGLARVGNRLLPKSLYVYAVKT